MAVDLKESRTKENLMRAFAGESQARNRYTIAAEEAKKQGMYALADIFTFTAEQERAHAERYYELLSQLTGETIEVDGGYPVDPKDPIGAALKAAGHNEMAEYKDVYPAFGDVAKEEGFLEAASAFYQIAEIEHVHAERFEKLRQMMEDHTFYEREQNGRWMCMNCGYIHEGRRVPEVCPVCRHEKGYFIPLSFAPYMGMDDRAVEAASD
ncbi:rubrerythrin [Hespellia stercorisuis]|uniref:Rubrerythrin n=1 Tax=Hespellia stercorisuis DSM 15480 TaxID=1121950 RepID=A0A1M6M9K7_9FIRM|nr:rubrerythrin family protein [Hespellia stercorisuis]SHJ80157.1 Rubrerythrin [Hespellia stercorisuis DSM 15480]